jgi:hypothetical protein
LISSFRSVDSGLRSRPAGSYSVSPTTEETSMPLSALAPLLPLATTIVLPGIIVLIIIIVLILWLVF